MTTIGSHGLQGPHHREDHDIGCVFSDGAICQVCPFTRCVDELDWGDRIRFGQAWGKDRAMDWRKLGPDDDEDDEDEDD